MIAEFHSSAHTVMTYCYTLKKNVLKCMHVPVFIPEASQKLKDSILKCREAGLGCWWC